MTQPDNIAEVRFHGAPVGPDVDALRKAFPADELRTFRTISHAKVSEVIGYDYGTHRYDTVVRAWRRSLETDDDILLGSVVGMGYRALTHAERLDYSCGKLRSSYYASRRSGEVAGRIAISELNDEQRARHQLVARRAAFIATAYKLRPTAKLPQLEMAIEHGEAQK